MIPQPSLQRAALVPFAATSPVRRRRL